MTITYISFEPVQNQFWNLISKLLHMCPSLKFWDDQEFTWQVLNKKTVFLVSFISHPRSVSSCMLINFDSESTEDFYFNTIFNFSAYSEHDVYAIKLLWASNLFKRSSWLGTLCVYVSYKLSLQTICV